MHGLTLRPPPRRTGAQTASTASPLSMRMERGENTFRKLFQIDNHHSRLYSQAFYVPADDSRSAAIPEQI